MSYYQTTKFNPYLQYSMYPMYNCGYNQPMLMGLPYNTALPLVQQQTQQPQINTNNLDSVSFSANKEIQQQTKEGLSTGAKWAIGIGATTALAVGADFLFCKGKHVKSLLGKSGKSNGSKGGNGSSVGGNTSSTTKPSGTSKPPKNPVTPSNTGNGTTNSSSVSGGTSSPNTSSTSNPPKAQNKPSSSTTTNTVPVNATNTGVNNAIDDMRAFVANKYNFNGDYNTSPVRNYASAIYDNYLGIRTCPADYYTMKKPCDPNRIFEVSKSGGSNIIVDDNDGMGWFYRFATKNLKVGQERPKVIDRISLNVHPDENLIRELDDFIARTGVNVEYKVPQAFNDWLTRHDPITMYFRESIPQNVKEELIKIVTPYVRTPKSEVMIGTKLANGIYLIPDPTEQDVLRLIKRAEKLGDEKLIECLKACENPLTSAGLYHYSHGKPIVKTSAGQFRAAEMLIEDLERFKSGIV